MKLNYINNALNSGTIELIDYGLLNKQLLIEHLNQQIEYFNSIKDRFEIIRRIPIPTVKVSKNQWTLEQIKQKNIVEFHSYTVEEFWEILEDKIASLKENIKDIKGK